MPDTSWWVDENQLDDEQADVVSLPPDGSFLVLGPPGSGKTNLLLLRASYLTDSQLPNLVVLTFTRSLRDFVMRGSDKYAFDADKVLTIMAWMHRLIREHGGSVSRDAKPFDELRAEYTTALAAIFDMARDALRPSE